MADYSNMFDEYYFMHGCGKPYERNEEWLLSFEGFAAQIESGIGPGTVLDAGCAMGFLVERLRAREIEAYGIDISEYAISQVHESVKPYCWVGSIAEPFPQKYDLIVTIEVLEHMPKAEAELAIANLCRHSDDILFSSTPMDFKEATHINVQQPEYWAAQFARHGYFRDVDFDASFITPWAVRFRKRGGPVQSIVQDYERRFWPLWKENHDLRALIGDMRQQLADQEGLVHQLQNQLDVQKTDTAEIEELREKLGTLELQSITQQQELSESRQESTRLCEEIDLASQALSQTKQELNQIHEDLAQTQQELSQKNAIIENQNDQIHYFKNANSQLLKQIQEWDAHWYVIQKSTTWRAFQAAIRIQERLAPLGSRRRHYIKRVLEYFQRTKATQEVLPESTNTAEMDKSVVKEKIASGPNTISIENPPIVAALYTSDPWSAACTHLRVTGPAAHSGSGLKVLEGSYFEPGLRIKFPEQADFVLVQRDFPRHSELYQEVVHWAQSTGKPLVYEIDDLLMELPDEHPEQGYYLEARQPMLQALSAAQAVFTSTGELAKYARRYNDNAWVLPNYLDDHIWKLAKSTASTKNNEVVIGYMGGVTRTHVPDLEMIKPVLLNLLTQFPHRLKLRFWGMIHPELAQLPNVEFKQDKFGSYPDFAHFFSRQNCDLFIAPLRDSLFNRCKSPIKFIEYSSLAIPGVYSQIEPYSNVIRHGRNGFLAANAEDWSNFLTKLILDPQLRNEIGWAARQTVAEDFLLSQHAHEWGTLYRSALAKSGTVSLARENSRN